MEKQENSLSLEQYLDGTDGLEDAVGTEMDIVSGDDVMASQMLRRLGAIEKQIEANSAIASAERQRITDWEVSVNTTLQNNALYLRSVLEQYALHERIESDRKTINLPFGVLKTTPTSPKWTISDRDEFVAWAERTGNNDLVRIKKEPALSELKSKMSLNSDGVAVDEIGMEVPHVVVEHPEKPFNVNVKPNV